MEEVKLEEKLLVTPQQHGYSGVQDKSYRDVQCTLYFICTFKH